MRTLIANVYVTLL